MRNKLASALRILFAIALLAIIGNIVYELFLRDFEGTVKAFVEATYEYGKYDTWVEPHNQIVFWGLRIVFTTLFFYLGWRFYNTVVYNKHFLYKADQRHFEVVADGIIDNIKQVRSSSPEIKTCLAILFGIQIIAFTFFLFQLPYQYDEAWTFSFFSGKSIISSLTFYPVPNNHVFHNVVSSVFLLLPIDEILALRLPNFLASFITIYYFFKLNRFFVPIQAAFIATTLLAFSWPVMYYSAQGRGYGLLLMFATLCLYSFACIVNQKSEKKYFTVFVISAALGFFCVPSFLYFFLVLNAGWFIYYVFTKQLPGIWKLFIANVCIVILTLLFYGPILDFEGWGSLTANNGVIKRDFNFLRDNFRYHLRDTWQFIVGEAHPRLFWLVPFFVALAVNLVKGPKQKRLFTFLCLMMLVSPFPIVFLHKVIPFERTWIFIVLPLAIAAGFLIDEMVALVNYMKRKQTVSYRHIPFSIVAAFILSFGVYKTARNKFFHEQTFPMDYVIHAYNALLDDKFAGLGSISYPEEGMGFYIAEDFRFESFRRNAKKEWPHTGPIEAGKQPGDDMIIVLKNTPILFSLEGYREVGNENKYFRVFLREDYK